jgi:cell division septum initiation protein DivIVA
MAQFKYILPSGAAFTMEAPAGTTQNQADYIFYSQVAAGALVGFVPGQTVSGTTSSLVKFELSRLDRGTAGIDDTVILAIINGLPTVNTVTNAIPPLINTPLTNPATRASLASIVNGRSPAVANSGGTGGTGGTGVVASAGGSGAAGSGFTAPAIGALSSDQTLALMAQVANLVNQPVCTMTNDKGVGQYGLNCQQLEMSGYVKPGTYQKFLQSGSNTLVDVLSAPGIWTGLGGVKSSTDFLNNATAQNTAQAALMDSSYNSLQAAGVITTPAAQGLSAVVKTVYTGTTATQTAATVADTVNGQVAALVTNSSQFGTGLASQWASGLPPVTDLTSNLTGIAGVLGTVSLASAQGAMDTLGKASQFVSNAASPLSNLNLSNLSVSGLADKLSGSASAVADKLSGSASALAGQIQGQVVGQANALIGQAQLQANALISQAQGQLNSLLGQADSLVASVQKAAGFTNTINRASVDVAMTKVFGSAKISVPNFGVPDSASIGAALDIGKAQAVLKDLQGQATGLINQAQGIASQAQGTANNLIAGARNAVNRLG